MADIKSILKKAEKEITPSKALLEKQRIVEKEILFKIQSVRGKHLDAMLCGSAARNTHLSNDIDLDFFVFYPHSLSRREFEKEGLSLGKKVLKGHKHWKEFAEHPYIKGVYKGFRVELVPTYRVSNASLLQSAVDRSPFHLKYLQGKLDSRKKQDVRLLKAFLKSFNAYGAKLRINSLPGFALELLVLHYGCFSEVLKAISSWKDNTVIDVNHQFRTEQEAMNKFRHHLIIVDPTDSNRNVAAALNFNQFARIIMAARLFLKKPSINFFKGVKGVKLPLRKTKELLSFREILLMELPYPKNSHPEIVFGQLKRIKKKMKTQLQLNDFKITRIAFWSNEKNLIYFIIELNALEIEKIHKRVGPEVFSHEHSSKFIQSHLKSFGGPRIQKGRVVLEEKRKFWKAHDFLLDYWKKEQKKEKSPIKQSLKKVRVFYEKKALQAFKKDKGFALFLSEFLEGKDRIFYF